MVIVSAVVRKTGDDGAPVMICARCRNPVPDEPWYLARRAGFDAALHCGLLANARGVVVARVDGCVGLCEYCRYGRVLMAGVAVNTAKG